jgi:hypothetical protein
MFDKFRFWYNSNYSQITWFLIGFLTWAGLNDLAQGDYTGAVISFGIAFLNYLFVKKS